MSLSGLAEDRIAAGPEGAQYDSMAAADINYGYTSSRVSRCTIFITELNTPKFMPI